MRLFIGKCCLCDNDIHYYVSAKEDFFKLKCTSCHSEEPFINWNTLKDLASTHRLIIRIAIIKIIICLLATNLLFHYDFEYLQYFMMIGIGFYLYIVLVNLYQYLYYPYYKYLINLQVNSMLKKSGIFASKKISKAISFHIKNKTKESFYGFNFTLFGWKIYF